MPGSSASPRKAWAMVNKDLLSAKLAELADRRERVRARNPDRAVAQGFTRLEEQGVLRRATAEALRRAVGFRNVVAHGYSRLDLEAAHAAASSGLVDISAFAREVSAWAAGR